MENYDYVGKYSEGLIRFKIGVFPYFKCGFIDITNKVVIPPIYSNVRDFHNGLARAKIGNWSSGKWGFINTSGELVIDFLFDKPRRFSDGYAKVVLNGEWCFINLKGEKVISLKDYDGGSSFHHGYAIVAKKKSDNYGYLYGIIDKNGNEVVPCEVDSYEKRKYFDCGSLKHCIKLYNSGYYE